MRYAFFSTVRSARLLVAVVLLGRSLPLPAQDPNSPESLEDRFRTQCEIVLSTPHDGDALKQLNERGKDLRNQRRDALDALARGLASYTAGQPESAAEDLKKAATSKYVRNLANAVLTVPLEDMTARHTRRAEPTRGDCESCFGTGWAVCRRCNGMGTASFCPDCKGRGCRSCRGSGVSDCLACMGTGFVECAKCKSQTNTSQTKPNAGTGNDERTAIDKLVLKVDYLRRGGIDYFTADGLRCSPRLGP